MERADELNKFKKGGGGRRAGRDKNWIRKKPRAR